MKRMLLLTAILGLSSQLLANEISEFEKEVHDAQKICMNLRCEKSPLKILDVDPTQERELISKLAVISTEIANNSWADTILESGVVTSDDLITLNKIQLVMNKDGLRGYRISYSAVAYNMDICEDYSKVQTCQKGRIIESAFISTDFSAQFTDYADLAHFIEN